MRAGRLIVLCGLPGSGKTTVARELEREVGGVRLCSDEWMTTLGIDLFDQPGRVRVEALQQELIDVLLRAGVTVVYESGGWSRAERDAMRDRVRAVGARVELCFLDVPLETLWERLSRRNEERPPATGVIPYDDLREWAAAFERPDDDELGSYDPPEA